VMWSTEEACRFYPVHLRVFWISIYNILTVLNKNCDGRDIVLFLATITLNASQPFDLISCGDDRCKAAVWLLWIGLILVIIACAFFAPREASTGFKKEELTTTPRGWASIAFLILVTLGACLIWAGKNNGKYPAGAECFTVVLLMVVVILEVMAWTTSNSTLAFIALSLMYSTVSISISRIYGNTDQQMRAGYIMCMVSSLASLALPIDLAAARSRASSGSILEHRMMMALSLVLICVCLLCWSKSNYDVVSGYLGILSLISWAAGYRVGTLVCFNICGVYLPRVTPFTAAGDKSDYLLSLFAVMAMLSLFAQQSEPQEGRAKESRQGDPLHDLSVPLTDSKNITL